MSTDTERTAREMRRLHEEKSRIRIPVLAPDERDIRSVWSTFRWAELLTALGSVAWIFAMWVAWISK